MADDNPGVIVFPPALYLGGLLVGAVIDWIAPSGFAGLVPSGLIVQITGGAALVFGIAIMTASTSQFRKAGTNVSPMEPTEALVTVGIYRFTRNPIYVGVSALYVGLALLFDNPWSLALILPILLVIRYGVIAREEKYLEAKFGEAYTSYKQQVRRWL